jgi:hypothetical protein
MVCMLALYAFSRPSTILSSVLERLPQNWAPTGQTLLPSSSSDLGTSVLSGLLLRISIHSLTLSLMGFSSVYHINRNKVYYNECWPRAFAFTRKFPKIKKESHFCYSRNIFNSERKREMTLMDLTTFDQVGQVDQESVTIDPASLYRA